MNLDEHWNLILLMGFFAAGAMAFAKFTLNKILDDLGKRFEIHEKGEFANHEQLNKRLGGIEMANREEVSQWQRMEREFLTLKADLPLHYVRREDYIRGQSVLEAKLDGLGMKIENAQLRATKLN